MSIRSMIAMCHDTCNEVTKSIEELYNRLITQAQRENIPLESIVTGWSNGAAQQDTPPIQIGLNGETSHYMAIKAMQDTPLLNIIGNLNNMKALVELEKVVLENDITPDELRAVANRLEQEHKV